MHRSPRLVSVTDVTSVHNLICVCYFWNLRKADMTQRGANLTNQHFLCLLHDFIFDNVEDEIRYYLHIASNTTSHLALVSTIREPYHLFNIEEPECWVDSYNELVFYQLYRMKKETFYILLETLVSNDHHNLIKKKYRGGNLPVQPEKALLISLWYLSKQDTLNSIAERFRLVPSTIMRIINAVLFILLSLKKKYIFWPSTEEEFNYIQQQFTSYPGVIGAVDGTHVNIKVPIAQHDSYVDRFLSHSINVMGICTFKNIFIYVFIGFPGSAHDSRVFQNSSLVAHLTQHGKKKYFPKDEYHLLGDSAFPLRTWLMVPYKKQANFTRMQTYHNERLSSDRVCIEHTFGILKGRWRRLQFINTYSISKAIEITTTCCILHNFCYLNNDLWDGEQIIEPDDNENLNDNERNERLLGSLKRDQIAQTLFHNRF